MKLLLFRMFLPIIRSPALIPAGMKIKFVRQEPAPGNKLHIPCRIENKAGEAGAIPAQQASHTLPD